MIYIYILLSSGVLPCIMQQKQMIYIYILLSSGVLPCTVQQKILSISISFFPVACYRAPCNRKKYIYIYIFLSSGVLPCTVQQKILSISISFFPVACYRAPCNRKKISISISFQWRATVHRVQKNSGENLNNAAVYQYIGNVAQHYSMSRRHTLTCWFPRCFFFAPFCSSVLKPNLHQIFTH